MPLEAGGLEKVGGAYIWSLDVGDRIGASMRDPYNSGIVVTSAFAHATMSLPHMGPSSAFLSGQALMLLTQHPFVAFVVFGGKLNFVCEI